MTRPEGTIVYSSKQKMVTLDSCLFFLPRVNWRENLVLIEAPNKYPWQPFMLRQRVRFPYTKVNAYCSHCLF
jgi:hypothetical protein